MDQKLFSNVVLVNAEEEEVRKILESPENLLKWIPEITTVEKGNHDFSITRVAPALNQQETITVEKGNNSVTYNSKGGRLEYRIVFLLSGQDRQTTIQEDVYVEKQADIFLPLKLLAPIAKYSFNTNLNNLAAFIESKIVRRNS
ncbi:SRPBCC family protein [Lactobacillus sp. UCMA15818]|uniref:SRPBCC family protein n=1 Tax=Lactobacillaceae TaxID=33958 RepID=UPI0025B1D141|nr:SRPBCC family protein [Lactobacillus sp. UCMA15818]MDN2453672.1 SRPBCC family protein [Lactobacillus sp. UCMA15818]